MWVWSVLVALAIRRQICQGLRGQSYRHRTRLRRRKKLSLIRAATGTLDGIIDTVSAVHPLQPLLGLLKTNGKLITVGVPDKPLELYTFPLILGRKLVGGSAIGGMKETQEMIDFAAKKGVAPNIEVIPIDYVNTAMQRMLRSDVKYRFVIDIGSTLKASDA
ncbi:Probable mannitol dehydrogenase [Dionaea muscipula]